MAISPHGLILSLVIVLCATAAAAAECDKVIVTADPDYPPLHWDEGGRLVGASIDTATRVLHDIGVPYEVRNVGPFARVLRSAQLAEVDLVTSLKITPERRVYLAFTTTPISSNPIAVFVDKGAVFPYREWKDLVGKQGSAIRGNRFGAGFDEFMRDRLAIDKVNWLEQSFRMLEVGRADYVVTGLLTGQAFIAENGLGGRFVALKPYVTNVNNYSGFVRSSPCVKYLAQYDQRLKELTADGEVELILQRNIEGWARQKAEAKKRAR